MFITNISWELLEPNRSYATSPIQAYDNSSVTTILADGKITIEAYVSRDEFTKIMKEHHYSGKQVSLVETEVISMANTKIPITDYKKKENRKVKDPISELEV